ncbi:MAG: amidohydrolase family protein [Pseudohongiellaceae bacterium]
MRIMPLRLVLTTLLGLALAAPALAETRAFVGARILSIADDPIDDGVLVIEDSRIVAVGARGDVSVPRDAELVELDAGTVIMPGIVDTHSHIGEVSGADRAGPIQPENRALDSVNLRSSGLKRALAGGITSVHVMSGSGHLISGQTLYLKLRDGNRIEELAYRFEDGAVAGGLKMANGTNPMGDAPFPGTRAKSAALLRQAYLDAQDYRDKRARDEEAERPPRDLGKDALVEVLEGRRIAHHHTHRHDDVITAMRLREEFGYRLVLHHVSEAWKVADEIAAADVPVSLIALDSPGGKLEAIDVSLESGGVLEEAGATVAFHTDDWITDSRYFLRMAAMSVRGGMSREAALRAMTIEGARMLDLADRVGTLESGKDADFVILSGDPLSSRTRVLETWVEGVRRFDLDDPEDRLVAEGGPGALTADDGAGHIHGIDGSTGGGQ